MPEPCCPWCNTPLSQHRQVGGSRDCLNTWVAQVVLGCDVVRTDRLGFSCGCQSHRGHHPPPHGWTEFHDGLADFSGEIAAAWQVVARLRPSYRKIHIWLWLSIISKPTNKSFLLAHRQIVSAFLLEHTSLFRKPQVMSTAILVKLLLMARSIVTI